MDIYDLRDASFESLGAAVADWDAMVKKLEALEQDAQQGLKGLADKANWKGVNAGVSKEFITKTAGEFTDAHTEATTVHNILKDTHDELVSYQKQLKGALEAADTKNLLVTSCGGDIYVTAKTSGPNGPDPSSYSEADMQAVLKQIQGIMANAIESDSSAAKVLDELMKQDPYGFSDASYKDRDTAAKAVEDAEKYSQYLKKGDDLSPEEFDALNKALAAHKNDPLFQEKFAELVGPRGVVDFWADISDGTDGGDLQRARRDQLGTLQANLGMTLAGATHSDSPAMQQWKHDMIALGDDSIKTHGANAYGFQLMSNLMRVGDYDDQFLNDYGDALVATEKKMGNPDRYWQMGPGGGLPAKMNFIGEHDFGRDPMTGFMNGLTNSPDAATKFFTTMSPQDNAEWVLKDRPSFDDSPLDDDGNFSLEATGRALTAATTGINPNGPHPAFVEHTPLEHQALNHSLGILADAGDDMHSEFRDDMAKVISNWGPEAVHTASSQYDDPHDPLQLNRHDLLEVTKQVSRDGGAYRILGEGMNHAIVNDIMTSHPDDPKESLIRAGAAVGFLEEARYQALGTDEPDPTWKARFISHGIGAAAGFIPEVGGIVGRGADLAVQAWADDERARIEQEHVEQTREVFGGREQQLHQLAEVWKQQYPGQMGHGGYDDYTLVHEINGAAFDGNQRAKGLAGDN